MLATPTKPKQMLTFDRFIKQLPDEDGRYELVNGEIVKILPTIRLHENVADFIENTFHDEVKRLNLNYRISGKMHGSGLYRFPTTASITLRYYKKWSVFPNRISRIS